MPKRFSSKSKDPELQRQLEAAARTDATVQVVFYLKSATMPQRSRAPVAEETEATVKDLLARVEKASGERVADWHVFPRLGSFVVQASPRVVEALLAQDEIASASANRRSTE